mmetsp:Transcript_72710/g.144129  ORF Transcript_72710/g.144129 Transcript_72710/m.144129 type:complete len:107 (+) Transcript_72710:487-807(+)
MVLQDSRTHGSVDEYIDHPPRETENPLLIAVEDVLLFSGSFMFAAIGAVAFRAAQRRHSAACEAAVVMKAKDHINLTTSYIVAAVSLLHRMLKQGSHKYPIQLTPP